MLTDADRTALMQAAHRADVAGCACHEVFAAVEAIVAAHVTAALNAAADVIDGERDRSTLDDALENYYRAGLSDAARIVRTATP